MAIILLDTSVIFDHLNGRYGRTTYLEQLIEQGMSSLAVRLISRKFMPVCGTARRRKLTLS
jgi:hypothetical protein